MSAQLRRRTIAIAGSAAVAVLAAAAGFFYIRAQSVPVSFPPPAPKSEGAELTAAPSLPQSTATQPEIPTAPSTTMAQARLYEIPARFTARYGAVRSISDGGEMQVVDFKDPALGANILAVGVRAYPNPAALTAEQWLRANWDPEQTVELSVSATDRDAVVITDATKWLRSHDGESDFPVLAAIKVREQIVVIDRLNGASAVPLDTLLALLVQGR